MQELKCIHTLSGHSDGVSCISIDMQDTHIISGSYDGHV